jgi:hypothetical protein
MLLQGWKVPPRASTEEGRQFQPSCSHPDPNLNPIAVAKARLMDLECAIERRYLKPPLGTKLVPSIPSQLGKLIGAAKNLILFVLCFHQRLIINC